MTCDCGTLWTFLLPLFQIWRLHCHYLFLISPSFSVSGKAVLCDCGISCVSSLIYLEAQHCIFNEIMNRF